ncbi:aldo/keto reductase [Crossiella cryophila]|uniref:Aryl-alcohol dehydrogenase-like predicted oxidoreductase n=1 Tax=Crossiella cryophila TaxID=43355 RepID=A0A7W7CCB0_9PSEU|nr:aldo/keto reductase [Crossiella cryophila]MBB4676924.1 aryl-alcohol dehydrogenase-like predicted oxidoreductase [Crossiella cryophila]
MTISDFRLGFGAMRLTGWDRPNDPASAIAVARRAVELGVDFIDTADAYGLGTNEELLAAALHPYPAHLTIGTKAGQSRPGPSAWVPLGRPEYLRQQVELSLRRLRVDRLDLFQLHRIDPKVPAADQFGVLADLVREGKAAKIGLSEVTVPQLIEARTHVEIASVQNQYNLTDRRHEAVLDHCTAEGITFIPWLPIAGTLTHPDAPVAEVAREVGASPAQVALSWLLHHSPVIVPIPGTSSLAHLEENIAARELSLTPAQLARLSQ